MALVNLTQAAKLARITRTTLYKHIDSGKISKTTAPDGTPAIDTAELMRVYGKLDNDTASSEHGIHQDLQQEITTLRMELKAAHDLLEARENHIADLQKMNTLLTEKLTPPLPSVTPQPQEQPPSSKYTPGDPAVKQLRPPKRTLLDRIFRRAA